MSPRPIIHSTRVQAEQHVAREIVELIAENPRAIIGVATGSTMAGVYRALVSAAVERSLDTSGVTCFSLDAHYLALGQPGWGIAGVWATVAATQVVKALAKWWWFQNRVGGAPEARDDPIIG